jgi:hypothetical protein
LSRKVVHNWVEKFYRGGSKDVDDDRQGVGVAGTAVEGLLCC